MLKPTKKYNEKAKAEEKKKEEEHKTRSCGQKIKFWIYGKIMATTQDDMKENFDNLLAYIMINVPFNLLLSSCSSTSWELLREKTGTREDHAGLFVMASDIAVDIVDMPPIFMLTVAYFVFMAGPWLSNVKAKVDQQKRTSMLCMLDGMFFKIGRSAEETEKEMLKRDRTEFNHMLDLMDLDEDDAQLSNWLRTGFTWADAFPLYLKYIFCQPCHICKTCRKGSKANIIFKPNPRSLSTPRRNPDETGDEKFELLTNAEKYVLLVHGDIDYVPPSYLEEHFADDSKLFEERTEGEKTVTDTTKADKAQKYDKKSMTPSKLGKTENFCRRMYEPTGRERYSALASSNRRNIYGNLENEYNKRILANFSYKYLFATYVTAITFLVFFAWLGISVWLFLQQVSQINMSFELGQIMLGTPIPFVVPDAQLPIVSLSCTYGAIKMTLLMSKVFKSGLLKMCKCGCCNKKKMKVNKKSEIAVEDKTGGGKNVGTDIAAEKAKEQVDAKVEEKKQELQEKVDAKLQQGIDGKKEEEKEEKKDDLADVTEDDAFDTSTDTVIKVKNWDCEEKTTPNTNGTNGNTIVSDSTKEKVKNWDFEEQTTNGKQEDSSQGASLMRNTE